MPIETFGGVGKTNTEIRVNGQTQFSGEQSEDSTYNVELGENGNILFEINIPSNSFYDDLQNYHDQFYTIPNGVDFRWQMDVTNTSGGQESGGISVTTSDGFTTIYEDSFIDIPSGSSYSFDTGFDFEGRVIGLTTSGNYQTVVNSNTYTFRIPASNVSQSVSKI